MDLRGTDHQPEPVGRGIEIGGYGEWRDGGYFGDWKFFGIRSPSTVMAEMGENLMNGLAKGIEGASSQATSAMTAVSQDLIGALTVPSGSFSLSADASAALGVSAGGHAEQRLQRLQSG
jgi:hypothetical protein